jgi:hypothetical protein
MQASLRIEVWDISARGDDSSALAPAVFTIGADGSATAARVVEAADASEASAPSIF